MDFPLMLASFLACKRIHSELLKLLAKERNNFAQAIAQSKDKLSNEEACVVNNAAMQGVVKTLCDSIVLSFDKSLNADGLYNSVNKAILSEVNKRLDNGSKLKTVSMKETDNSIELFENEDDCDSSLKLNLDSKDPGKFANSMDEELDKMLKEFKDKEAGNGPENNAGGPESN